jgi:glycosyltransferase involved in cell wall biosynthesis
MMPTPIRVLMVTPEYPSLGEVRTTHFIRRQKEFLEAAGVEIEVFHFEAHRKLRNYARAWLRLRKMVRRGRYDLIHAQFGQSGLLALPRCAPYVVTLRGSDLLGIVGPNGRYTLAGKLLQFISRMVARRADGVVVVSEHMKDLLPSSVDASVIPSGLEFDRFHSIPRDEARRHLGLPLDARLVLFVGNPAAPRKRFALAQQAVELVNRSLPAQLVVAFGAAHSDVAFYMNACDALVFTSMQEGSPNVVKEALACDLPVVSVAIGDVPLRLSGIQGCELCADDRPETIAAALERVLRTRRRIAGHAAVQDLDESLLTSKVIDVYRSILSRKSRPEAAPARVRRERVSSALPSADEVSP